MKLAAQALRLSLAVGLTVAASASFADDLVPPPWRLGNASATVQEWDFATPANPSQPDGNIWGSGGGGYVNPFGIPLMNTNSTWLPSFGARTGLYQLNPPNDFLNFEIPNDGDPNDQKDMWIQITSLAPGSTFVPSVDIIAPGFSGPATLVQQQFLADGFIHSVWQVHMPICPTFERVLVTNQSPTQMFVDQVVIDTICNPVPEPATLAACGTAGLAFLRRRRKK